MPRPISNAMIAVVCLALLMAGFAAAPARALTQPPPGTVVEISLSGRDERLDEDPLLYRWVESFSEKVSARATPSGLAGTVTGEQYQQVSYPSNDFHPAACSSFDRFRYSAPVQGSLTAVSDDTWEVDLPNVPMGADASVESAPDCEYASYAQASAAAEMSVFGGTIAVRDSDPDPAHFAGTATFDPTNPLIFSQSHYQNWSLTVSVDSAPATTTPQARSGCKRASPKTFKYKTYTSLPGPDPHWFTTKLTVDRCRKKGKDYITGLKAKRHVENGLVPRLLGLAGWSTRTDSPTQYSPSKIPKGGTKSASARLQYTACFDLTKLLGKGLQKVAQKKLKKPLRKSIKKILKKAKIDKVNPKVRASIANSWNRKVDHVFRKGTISTFLRDKMKIPKSIGRYVEKLALPQLEKAKGMLKGEVQQALSTGRYDGLSATAAADAIISGGFLALDRMINYCGGRPGSESLLTLWDVSLDLTGGVKKLKASADSYYLHPMMRVKRA